MNMDKRDHQIIEYINSISDKESPLFKTIAFYLRDERYVEELKDYFNSRLSLFCLTVIILMNVILIGEMIFIFFSYYDSLLKIMMISLLLLLDSMLIRRYRDYLSVSYKYRLMYLFIESIPYDVLMKVYERLTKKDLYHEK